MIGLGAQDTEQEAVDFVEDYGTKSFRMLYDPTLESWFALGVRGQPTAILFDAEGKAHFVWYGPFDLNEALEAARTF